MEQKKKEGVWRYAVTAHQKDIRIERLIGTVKARIFFEVRRNGYTQTFIKPNWQATYRAALRVAEKRKMYRIEQYERALQAALAIRFKDPATPTNKRK